MEEEVCCGGDGPFSIDGAGRAVASFKELISCYWHQLSVWGDGGCIQGGGETWDAEKCLLMFSSDLSQS